MVEVTAAHTAWPGLGSSAESRLGCPIFARVPALFETRNPYK